MTYAIFSHLLTNLIIRIVQTFLSENLLHRYICIMCTTRNNSIVKNIGRYIKNINLNNVLFLIFMVSFHSQINLMAFFLLSTHQNIILIFNINELHKRIKSRQQRNIPK